MTDFSRTDPVEALDRNSRGQGQGHKNSVVLKIFLICARFEAISEKKKGHRAHDGLQIFLKVWAGLYSFVQLFSF